MRRLGLLLGLLATVGCSMQPSKPSGPVSCPDLLRQADAAIAQAGVADGGAYRVPGFPWARSNRFLASFANELVPEQVDDWLTALRQLDRQARRHEWRNLNSADWPVALQVQVDQCADQQLKRLRDEDVQQLRKNVAVPDDYSGLARAIGVYPISQAFLAMGVAAYQDEVRERFKQPVPADQGAWIEWALVQQNSGLLELSHFKTDALGRWQLPNEQWRALIQRYAPSFLIDQQGEFDRPGQPRPGTAGEPPTLLFKPTIYWSVSWTRFQGQVLPQLNYHLWFSKRPPASALDFYAGALDGLIWRITLDFQGMPLVHDTIHACGCYHYIFPVKNFKRRAAKLEQERSLLPQGQVPYSSVSVVLESGTHYVERVIPPISAAHMRQQRKPLALQAYDQLLSVPLGDDNYRSLFEPNGLVAGSERLERYWLWPSGVISPGAMRQSGRHATAFLGRNHFDNPFLLQHIFESEE